MQYQLIQIGSRVLTRTEIRLLIDSIILQIMLARRCEKHYCLISASGIVLKRGETELVI